jgi:chorismate lyase/3-hydroxybenzoate synthase
MIARADVTDPTGRLLQSSEFIADPPPHLTPRPPLWVDEALGASARRGDSIGPVVVDAAGPLAVLATSVTGARALPADELRGRVAEAYAAIGRALTSIDRVPIRFWNFVPDPAEPMGDGLDRYMVFNAGRYDGYAQWLCQSNLFRQSAIRATPDQFGLLLPTASAVGVVSDDLVVWCLASDAGGTPVENPRQTPAYRYSKRYGPMPPCFSRATIACVKGQPRVLIGGTASIVGEDSLHEGDVASQLAETLRNLDALISAAIDQPAHGCALERLIDLRVYAARAEDAAPIRKILETRCPRAKRMEMALARVCRPELLVEIEGVAEI